MSGRISGEQPSPPAGYVTAAAISLVLALPTLIVLVLAGGEAAETAAATAAKPPGYTLSLLFFLVPVTVLGSWFLRQATRFERGVFCQSLGLLVSIGLVLDFLFGPRLFEWPNRTAVLGIMLPAVGGNVPVEEVVFFVSGFAFLLLAYIWCDGCWLSACRPAGCPTEPTTGSRRWGGCLAAISVALLAGAVLYKRFFSTVPEGFPGYLAYVVCVAIIPPACCFSSVAGRINWPAFSFTQLAMVLICLIWEVTLAIPQQWWSFRADMMTGISIRAWSGLPIEEPLVWVASTFTVVVTYEFLKLRARRKTSP